MAPRFHVSEAGVRNVTERRFSQPKVTSRDGTTIASDKAGQGPAVILVEGATGSRSDSAGLAKLLASDFTVYSYDRRGYRARAQTRSTTLSKRKLRILKRLLRALGKQCVYMTSREAGALALEAAARLNGKVKKLVIYEVPYDSSKPGKSAWREYRTTLSELVEADG